MHILFSMPNVYSPTGSPAHAKAEGGYMEGPECLALRSPVSPTLQGVATDGSVTVGAGFAPNVNTARKKDLISSPQLKNFPYLAQGPWQSSCS